MSYFTVNGLLPNSEDILHGIEKFGILENDELITLTNFKTVFQYFRNITIIQLEFRERIEDILKINMQDQNE